MLDIAVGMYSTDVGEFCHVFERQEVAVASVWWIVTPSSRRNPSPNKPGPEIESEPF